MTQLGKVYTTTLKYNEIEDEFYVEFEGELLSAIADWGWIVGDEIEWHVMDNKAAVIMNRSLYERTEEEKKEEKNDSSL